MTIYDHHIPHNPILIIKNRICWLCSIHKPCRSPEKEPSSTQSIRAPYGSPTRRGGSEVLSGFRNDDYMEDGTDENDDGGD